MNITEAQFDALSNLVQGAGRDGHILIVECDANEFGGTAQIIETITPGTFLAVGDYDDCGHFSLELQYIGYDFRLESVAVGDPEPEVQWPSFPGLTIVKPEFEGDDK